MQVHREDCLKEAEFEFDSKNRAVLEQESFLSCTMVTGDKSSPQSWDQFSIKSSGVLAQEVKLAFSVLCSTSLPFYSAGRNGSLERQIIWSVVDICHKIKWITERSSSPLWCSLIIKGAHMIADTDVYTGQMNPTPEWPQTSVWLKRETTTRRTHYRLLRHNIPNKSRANQSIITNNISLIPVI